METREVTAAHRSTPDTYPRREVTPDVMLRLDRAGAIVGKVLLERQRVLVVDSDNLDDLGAEEVTVEGMPLVAALGDGATLAKLVPARRRGSMVATTAGGADDRYREWAQNGHERCTTGRHRTPPATSLRDVSLQIPRPKPSAGQSFTHAANRS